MFKFPSYLRADRSARYAAGASLSPSKPFRPHSKLRLQLKAEGSKLKAAVWWLGYVKEQDLALI